MRPPPERTADGHHIVVDGRRWRATDPAIPEPRRDELTKILMAWRREVRRRAGTDALANARAGVQALRIPHQHSPTHVVTASFGVATLEPGGDGTPTVADLIDRADKHLYIAKRTGRNRVCAGEEEHSTL